MLPFLFSSSPKHVLNSFGPKLAPNSIKWSVALRTHLNLRTYDMDGEVVVVVVVVSLKFSSE